MKTAHVWKATEVLRESLQTSEYPDLFALGGLIAYLSKDSRYREIVDIQKMLRAEQNAREELLQVLQRIEKEIPYFKGVFDEISVLNQLESSQITRFFYELRSISDEVEVIEWLDELLNRVSMEVGKKGAAYTTPESINKLAVSILNPTEGSFYDGVSGHGGGILEAQRNAWNQEKSLKLYGQEINGKAWAISKIRLFISGDSDNQIIKGDVLSQPGFIEDNTLKKFDFVYMEAPFSMNIHDYDSLVNDQYNRFFYGMPSRSNADYAFISHALASLKDEGKAIVVATTGALFRGGAEGKIRKNIILADMIEAVISLPLGLYDSTGISVNLILFNKNKGESRKDKILFVQASELIVEKERLKRTLSDEAIQKIVNAIQEGKEISEFSTFVHLSELVDSTLNPHRYVLQSNVEIEGFGTVKFDMKAFENMDTIPLKNLANLFRGFNVGSKNQESDDGGFRIVRLSDVQNGKLLLETVSRYYIDNNAKIDMYKLQKDDVILSIRGNILKVAIVPENDENLLLSQNFIGIRCTNNLDPNFLKAYLESPLGQYLLSNKMSGTTIATLSRKDVETLEIPNLTNKKQMQIMEQYNAKEMYVEKELQRLKKEMMEIKMQTYEKMGISNVFSSNST